MNPSRLTRLTARALLGLAFIVTAVPDAHAQDGDLSTTAARDQYQKATDAAGRKDWAESRRLFLQLWKRSPTFDVASGLALAEFKLGHHAVGAHYMALALANMPIKENLDDRFRIEDTFKMMKATVGTVHLSVDKAGAEIRADDEVQGNAPLATDIFLEPGPHVIEAKVGEAHASKQIDVTAGQTYTMDLSLSGAAPAPIPLATSPMPVVGSGLDAKPNDHFDRGPEARTIALWTGVGITAVSAGIGIGFALKASSASDDAKNEESQLGPGACRSAANAATCAALKRSTDERNSANEITTISFAVAGVAALTTTALVLFWPTHHAETAGKVHVAPIATRNSGGLMLNGNF